MKMVNSESERRGGDVIRYATCGEHCFNMCIIKVHIRDGRIWAIEPDDTINRGIAREDGHLSDELIDKCMITVRPCSKGYAHICNLYDPNRLLYPMKRVGERGEGKWQRISWDEALDTIAKKLVEIKEKYGPLSIGYFSHDGFALSPWFGAGVSDWGDHSRQGVAEPEKWVLGRDTKEDRQDESNLLKSKLIVLWGFNPATTLSNHAIYTLLRARERGIPIISIETRYTPTAEAVASQWIPIRPTTDVSMMIAMANVWFNEDLCDKEFIKKWVDPGGIQRWKEYVLGTSDGVDKTPHWAEIICGVPAETIAEFARLYARSKPVNLNTSFSLGRQFYGENAIRAAMYLQALSGNTMSPGGTASAETACEFGRHEPTLPKPVVDWQRAPETYKAPALMTHFKWPEAIDLREKLDKGEMSKDEYNRIIGNVPGNEAPNIRMLILPATNPLMTHPDVNTNIRAFKKLDFSVVFSYHIDNPTAKYADIILPQMHRAFEGRDVPFRSTRSNDLFRMEETPNLNGNFFIYSQKCTDPPGEVKPRGWIWVQIAKRLGIAEQYSPRLANVPDDRWDETVEDLHREAYEQWAQMKEISPLKPPSWEEFQKKPVFRWEVKEPYYTYKNTIERGENPFKGTESGKIEFYSQELAENNVNRPGNIHGNAKRSEVKANPAGGPRGGGNLPPMAEMVLGGRATYHSKDVEKFPLLMSSPHGYFRIHTLLDNQPLLNQDCYRHAVWISVADAKPRGIVDDDLVRVYNDQAEIIMPAYVTSRVVPGTVNIFHGGWYTPTTIKTDLMPEGIDTRGAPNLLTHYNEHLPDTILDHLPCKALVEIEKWEGAK